MNGIRVIPLGGQGELGKSMYIVEVNQDMFLLDAGLMFPEEEMLGIDAVIPDISYVVENKERVKAILLSHGHDDHIGALSYVLKYIKAPVYGTRLTLALAKEKMKENDFKGNAEFIEIQSDSILNFPASRISFFRTNHSIPDSVGIAIHTEEGAIVYTGDFKFDQAATDMYKPEIGKMAALGEEGVLCLLSDSTGAESQGYTPSEAIVEQDMIQAFQQARGRLIVACFASNIIRIQHVFNAAIISGRKVVVVGKNIQRVYETALKLGYLTLPADLIIPASELKQYSDHKLVILSTGHQSEPITALQKMAKGTHKQVSIKPEDTVILAASPLKGGEVILFKTIDMLYRVGATVVPNRYTVHVTGHGSQEELKMMLNLMKPKYLIPVHGEYRQLYAHQKLGIGAGLRKDHVVVADKGDIIEMTNSQIRLSSKVSSGNILIDGSGVGDVGNIVLRDRRLLSQDGTLIVVVTLNRGDKSIAAGPEIISRGFVYVRESEKLMDEATELVYNIVQKARTRHPFDWAVLKQDIRDSLNQYLFDKTKRRPMILPIIMEI
ncbi:ribonuclease J [Peribacillus loiseleuriae]|uniref:Ribonuclease J n=1 Tax=Peribacillus loiseleuriae TaxID=1679170 RepID=A0A0K9H029_9BACI|nr:ribonuclease J [Peribacillus loiseleuriae]KMY52268.1 Zn-dependent hydrolase [Peribacillus loiseleuriae]